MAATTATPRTARSASRNQFLRWAGLVSFVLVAVSSLAGFGLWRSYGFEILSVQSNSMQPLISKGDAVVVQGTAGPATMSSPAPDAGSSGVASRLEPGDIITFPSPADPSVFLTHRILEINPISGRLVTKGDANTAADPVTNAASVIGLVRHTVPGGGFAVDALRSWWGLALLVYLPAAVVLVQEIGRVVRYYGRPTYQLVRY